MYRLFIGFIILGLFTASCSKDSTTSEIESITEIELESRNASQWCDGGGQELPTEWITGVYENGDLCCIELRTPYKDEKIQFVTTNFDFGSGQGSAFGNVINTTTGVGGEIEFCYDPEMGSHILINLPRLGLCFTQELIQC